MPTSLITKKRIAKAFKKQLSIKSFDKISVVDIMQEAEIRRQTFYNHFLDKYELLDWIFETELQEQVTDNLTYISGLKLLDELLYYIEHNQVFYKQLFEIKGQNDFVSYLEGYFKILMEKIINEYQLQGGKHVSEKERQFLISYHSSAWIGMIKEGLSQSPCQIQSYWKQMVAVVLASFSTL
ncbi:MULTISPECIES: dihydroxyacetone kinase transcriptional activator DhaS [Streptococcus]|uniref:Dihydroxyacetone kinase transcriptional activator n=1 Tax=Streptococcus ruminantium TaxID=1917441 RepID=A0A2Z5TQC8_9STRE|nr:MULTISPECIES: dihydroxyacetone kinase transcriptional activator DhaS [Streptococcus]MDQ8758678.1 dihydroxyacetone kinase transcriptional activator DhaS [Streptococcus ruminantium]MDQ8765510.1 dihydroxyacetone kinase transcriptional activator DhaS [Streptococcus ruminantium]MDQ8767098.1 dihydroxyacetone kinase transcriptional activator DhaS [Streptococcus ruminantium]MDQ8769241.1 dihydroxyacetone kinase transcriptional activator DhaS [Streptococcus ruminantium]MDQ8774045.1 dihydroxyacetone k